MGQTEMGEIGETLFQIFIIIFVVKKLIFFEKIKNEDWGKSPIIKIFILLE